MIRTAHGQLLILSMLSTLALALGCNTNHKIKYDTNTQAAATTKPGEKMGVTIQPEWLKNKKDRFDVLIWITNGTDKPVLMKASSFKMTFAGVTVGPKDATFLVELPPGQTKKQLLLFAMPATKPVAGEATLSVDPILEGTLENPGKKLQSIDVKLPVVKR